MEDGSEPRKLKKKARRNYLVKMVTSESYSFQSYVSNPFLYTTCSPFKFCSFQSCSFQSYSFKSYSFKSYSFKFCFFQSCSFHPVLYSHFLSSPVLSCPVISSPVLSSPVLLSSVLSSPVLSSPVHSSPVLSSPFQFSPFQSCNFQSCPFQSCLEEVLTSSVHFPVSFFIYSLQVFRKSICSGFKSSKHDNRLQLQSRTVLLCILGFQIISLQQRAL